MCLATDVSLTADQGVAILIPARSHTFMEIDHEIISTVILLSSAESFKKGCCQFQAKVCARSTGRLTSAHQQKSRKKVGIKFLKSNEKVGITGVKSRDSRAFPNIKFILTSCLK